jgi:hypothetical protein
LLLDIETRLTDLLEGKLLKESRYLGVAIDGPPKAVTEPFLLASVTELAVDDADANGIDI